MPKKSHVTTKSKRPADSDFTQQRMRAMPQNVSPLTLAIAMVVIGIFFIPAGTELISKAKNIHEQKITYDDGTSSSSCYISSSNQNRYCQVEFQFSESVSGPIYLYYELENFFQNHRRYYQSLSRSQLQGQDLSESDVSLSCSPLYKNGSLLLNPCGLIANSFFTDIFKLNTTGTSVPNLYLDESGIALASDKESLYKQVSGFQSATVTSASASCSSVGLPDSCQTYTDPNTQQIYKFYYPDDSTTQYLYETYPDQISPIDGVTDEHFIVWMKPSILPTFRKLYGSINGSFESGQKLVIDVIANYEVGSFDAKKGLVISTLGNFGGKNIFPGQAYLTVGIFALIFGLVLLVKEKYFGRTL